MAFNSIATNPGALPFLLADPNAAPPPVAPTLDASGMPKPGEIQPSTTIQTALGPTVSSGSRTEVASAQDRAARQGAAESAQALADAQKDPMLPGYAIDPMTGEEIGKPAPTAAAVPIPADTQVPVGKFGALPASAFPNMVEVDGGLVPKADVPPAPMHSKSQQVDANAAAMARAEAQAAQAKIDHAKALEEEVGRRQQSLTERIDEAMAKNAEARQKITNPEEKSFLQSVLQAFAVGAGAYGSAMTGAPNFALQIIQKKQDNDLAKMKLELDASEDQLKRLGASQAQIDKFRETKQANFLAKTQAELDLIKAKGAQLLGAFPNAKVEADKQIALAQANADKFKFEIFKDIDKKVKESSSTMAGGTKTEVIPGSKDMKGGTSVSDAEGKKANYGDQIVRAAKEIKSGPVLDDKDLARLNQNIMDMAAAAEQGTKSLTGAAKVQAMRALGLSPDSLTAGLPKEKKAVAQAWLNGTGLVIRDQSGAAITIPEDLRNWQIKGPQPGEGPGGYNRKLSNLEYEGNNMLKLAGPEAVRRLRGEVGAETKQYDYSKARENIPAPAKPTAPAPTGKQLAKGLTAEEKRDYVDAKRVKPDSKEYAGAQAAIRKLEAKARGEQ